MLPNVDNETILKALAAQKDWCKDYRNFFCSAWKILEPSTALVWNWHYKVLCDELQKQFERIARKEPREYDIIVNIFRRSAKTTLDNKLLVPWVWSQWPEIRFVGASYDLPLALEHALDSRTVIQSPWYQRLWGNEWGLQFDQNVKSFFRNDKGGYRITTAVGGGGAGKGGDCIIIDDPIDPEKASNKSKIKLMECISWYIKSMYQSVNNKCAFRMIVMQRVHEDDLSGYLLRHYPGEYKLFCIPGEDGDNVSPPELRNFYINGLAFPARLNRDEIDDRKEMLGNDFHAQVNQRPTSPEGGMFKRHWWKFWRPVDSTLPDYMMKIDGKAYYCPVVDLPKDFDDEADSWDMGLTGDSNNDPCQGAHWARTVKDFFLIDERRGWFSALKKEEEVISFGDKHPNSSVILIEDATGGSDTIRYLQTKIPKVIGRKPGTSSKEVRAIPAAKLCESGNMYLPHPLIASWVLEFIEEMALLGRGTHDERIDTTSQVINHFHITRRVFSQYGGESEKFEIGFRNLDQESKIIIGQWMDRNQQSSLVFALWNPYKGKLHIFGEYYNELSVPETIRSTVNFLFKAIGKIELNDLKNMRWFGSEMMHKAATGNIQLQYASKKIRLEEVPNYDEGTAINRLGRLFVQKNIVIHSRCDILKKQMVSWTYEKKGRDFRTVEGHGFCKSLCLVVSAIWMGGQIKKEAKQIKPYSQQSQEAIKRVERKDQGYGLSNKYGWMTNKGEL